MRRWRELTCGLWLPFVSPSAETSEYGAWFVLIGVPCSPPSLPAFLIVYPVSLSASLRCPASPRWLHKAVGPRVTHQDGPHFRRDTGPGEGSGSWSAEAQGGRSRAGPGPWHNGICSVGGRAKAVNMAVLWSSPPLWPSPPPLFSEEGSSPSGMFSWFS